MKNLYRLLFVVFVVEALAGLMGSVSGAETVTLLPANCGVTSPPSVGQLIRSHENVADEKLNYTEAITSCRYTMVAESATQKLSFGFGSGNGELNAVTHVDGCTGASVSLFNSDGSAMFTSLCGSLSNALYTSSGDRLTLEVNSIGGAGTVVGFTAHFTSFYVDANCTDNNAGKFGCANDRCIDPGARCDANLINNCGDFSDNLAGPPSNCSSETTLAPDVTEESPESSSASDLSWLPYAAVGGLLAAAFVYWKCIKFTYLYWPCCNGAICKRNFLRKCCNPCNIFKCCRNKSKSSNNKPNSGSKLLNGGDKRNGSGPGSNKNGSPYGSSSNMFKSNKVADSEKVPPPPPPLFIGGLKREAHIGDFGSPLPPVAAETGFPPGMMRREKHIFSLQVD